MLKRFFKSTDERIVLLNEKLENAHRHLDAAQARAADRLAAATDMRFQLDTEKWEHLKTRIKLENSTEANEKLRTEIAWLNQRLNQKSGIAA